MFAATNNTELLCHSPPPFATVNEAAMLTTMPHHSEVSKINPLNQPSSPSFANDFAELKDLLIRGFKAMKVTFVEQRTETNNQPLHEINFSGFESSYNSEKTMSLESGSTTDFIRAIQNAPPLLTSSEANELELQTRTGLTSYTSSYTQTSSETSFNSTHSWEDTFDSFKEGDNDSQTTLSGNLPFKPQSHIF
ncbi:uncharacterized protein G2W53_001042 [Senna tora]|uniref:Uncharacterized protein n=1 Tax=Senna tora TaxID=362788 RepID=A0A834XFF8_9FABA|nr:uncharacterized protein G2W53_001042 [Senna tora]